MPGSAAQLLAGMLRQRLGRAAGDWYEDGGADAGGFWQWHSGVTGGASPTQAIAVDGRTRIQSVATPPRGPLIVACSQGLIFSIELPVLTDRSDLRRVLDVLEAAGALPPKDEDPS